MHTLPRMVPDTVYGHIPYTAFEERILQSRIFNRLLFVSQNALAYFAFPSVSTKRYIHSMGTMHTVSHLFRHALINTRPELRDRFLDDAAMLIEEWCKEGEKGADTAIPEPQDRTLELFDLGVDDRRRRIYRILLQALRLAGLLHDLGHLPFSHQSEDAMKHLYEKVAEQKHPNKEEREFLSFYERMTAAGKEVLHERLGAELLGMLFEQELSGPDAQSRRVALLYRRICSAVLQERSSPGGLTEFLHEFVASTVDADRIDYINRDLLASGYISSSSDLLRITRQSVLVFHRGRYRLSYYSTALYDLEHLLESRFNLYKKVFSTHEIKRLDTLLEKVITYLALAQLSGASKRGKLYRNITMLWKAFSRKNPHKKLDLISQMDENWLITLFKTEYFRIKYRPRISEKERFYLLAFEDILFGRRHFKSYWSNLSEFYQRLRLDPQERFRFRERAGGLDSETLQELDRLLRAFVQRWQNARRYFVYALVPLSIGIEKRFRLYDGERLLPLDEVSTVRKRLKTSLANTVPFFLYSSDGVLDDEMVEELRELVRTIFS